MGEKIFNELHFFLELYMNKLAKIFSIVLITIFLSIPSLAGQYKVMRIYDGDTVLCKMDDISIKVRLVGIDAPETSKSKRDPGQPYSQQSKKFLAGLVLNKNIEMKGYGNDKYNRVLSELFIDGKSVNLEMIKQGLAEAYQGKSPKGFKNGPYLEAEKDAKEASKGIWSLGGKYISPGVWRKSLRKH
jgi:micrococcal nuclease